VEVVEHEQDRRLTCHVRQQPDGRGEEPVAVGLGVGRRRRARDVDALAQPRRQCRQGVVVALDVPS
jgi:hypothetical protein